MVKQKILAAKNHTKKNLNNFKTEFKKHMTIAITAAFAFLIALVWRDAIQESINAFVTNIGIQIQNVYLYKIYIAILITVVGVIALIIFSRWGTKRAKT